MTTPVNRIFEFGPFRLDTAERVLLRDGQAVPLTLKTFDVLLFLVENSGHIVEKDELMNRVWAGSIVEEGNLKVTVSMLRKALEDNNGGARYIETVPRRGYRFVAEVSESANESAQLLVHEKTSATVTIQETTEIEGFRESAPANRRALKIGALIVFAVVSAGIAFVILRRSQNYPTRIPFQEVALRRLTNNRTVRDAALSPDGKLFAYSYTADKEGERGLWVGHVEGGEPILLRPPAAGLYSSLNFAPDNGSLYFVATNPDYPRGALFRMPVFGGAPEKLREGIHPNISLAPDFKHFAYVRSDDEQEESSLIVASLAATNEQKLAGRPQARPFVASSLTWSPDGTQIAIGALSNEASQANHEVFLVTAADGKMTQLTKRNFSTIRNLSWLRDGSGLMMAAIAHPELDAQLWYVSYHGGEVRRINPDSYNYSFSLNLSADDGSLLAIQTATLANIWIAPAADLGQAKRVTFGSIGRRDGLHGLDWTPSGRLVFTAAENQGEMLWEMAADGTDQKQLTSAGHVDNDLSVTANGRFIVFQSNRSGNEEVWRANADGGGLLQLTNGGGNEQPSVSSDGRWVVYISTRDKLSALWRVPLAGGAAVRLSDRPAAWPRVSPDGKLIACRYEVPTGSPKTKLAVIPIEGGPPILLFDVPSTVNFRYGVRWTPDGQSLTYRDWVNGIWRQPISGGEPQRLEGLPEEKLFAYGWSRDGKQFAFTRGTEIRDVVLIRNLR